MMNETQEQIKEENPVEENVIVDIDESEQKKLDTQPVVEKEEERTDVRSEQSEEELDEYSENVQKRINQLTDKRKQALEEADAAFRYAQEQKKQTRCQQMSRSCRTPGKQLSIILQQVKDLLFYTQTKKNLKFLTLQIVSH